MTDLPDAFRIPASTAATIRIDGEGITARDRSFMLSVACLAASGSAEFDGRRYLVHDHGLHALLGRTRSQRVSVELERYARMRATTITSDELAWNDESYVPAPSLPTQTLLSGVELPLRNKRQSGDLAWDVHPDLVEILRPRDNEPNVQLPIRLLAHARSRHTITLMLRVLGWLSEVKSRWVVTRKRGLLTLRIPIADFTHAMAISDNEPPNQILRRVVGPAVAEINELTDIYIDASGHHAVTSVGPRGMKSIELRITHPDAGPAPVETSPAAVLAKRARFNNPVKRPRPAPKTTPQIPSNVHPFRRPAAPMRAATPNDFDDRDEPF